MVLQTQQAPPWRFEPPGGLLLGGVDESTSMGLMRGKQLAEVVMLVFCVVVVLSAVLSVPVLIGLVVGLVHRQVDP